MKRIILIHWNASEVELRAGILKSAGYDAKPLAPQNASALRDLRGNPPDAFLIDLSRLPSQGRAVATLLRQQKETRRVPIVFVDGAPEKVARIRETLPDAVYTEWEIVRDSLHSAISKPPAEPLVPGTMDAYSASPLPRRLGIRAGSTVLLLGAPRGFEKMLQPTPAAVRLLRRAPRARMVLLFVKSLRELERRFPVCAGVLEERGGIWIVWPKKTSGVITDLTQAAVRKFGLDSGFVDYKICAIDETWSGLLFARRSGKRVLGHG